MNNNLPQKYKEGIFCKIKRFFANLFIKSNKKISISEELVNAKKFIEENYKKKEINDFKKSLFEEKASKDNYETGVKKSIIDTIEEKPEIIETISNENLKKLIKIYDEIIKENDIKIQRLTRKV